MNFYNLAISAFFGNLKLKNCVLLIRLIITSLYMLSVSKNLPVISNCCCLSNVFETISLVIFPGTFINEVFIMLLKI